MAGKGIQAARRNPLPQRETRLIEGELLREAREYALDIQRHERVVRALRAQLEELISTVADIANEPWAIDLDRGVLTRIIPPPPPVATATDAPAMPEATSTDAPPPATS